MAEIDGAHLGGGNGRGQGGGRARRHDAVLARDESERRAAHTGGRDGGPADTPCAVRGRVVAVPLEQALACDGTCERNAVIEPVLKRDKAPRILALLIERRKTAELA